MTLARTHDVAVAVRNVVAYPTGFELTVSIRFRQLEDWAPHHELFSFHRPARAGGELPPELFRFGIEFADGRKATSLGRHWGIEEEPAGPTLVPQGGGGGGRRYDQDFWVWPLPPAGSLALVCEWPARGVELTRATIDAEAIIEASGRAEELWKPGGSSSGFGAARLYR